jgi:hypothetical protein
MGLAHVFGTRKGFQSGIVRRINNASQREGIKQCFLLAKKRESFAIMKAGFHGTYLLAVISISVATIMTLSPEL